MNSVSEAGKKRLVIPRWRSLVHTPNFETKPSRVLAEAHQTTVAQFRNFLEIWRQSGLPEDSVDILDAGIATGSRALVKEGAARILAMPSQFDKQIIIRAKSMFQKRADYKEFVGLDATDDSYSKIASLKRVISDAPRNSLAHVEVALSYSRLLEFDKAERHLRIALAVAPDDRSTLRAVTRFYTMMDDPRAALNLLWSSTSLKFDPWIQSAELSAAMDAGLSPRISRKAAEAVMKRGVFDKEHSELVAGWVTKVFFAGESSKQTLKQIKRLVKQPTENALAQSIWLTDQLGIKFSSRFPEANVTNDAHEARAMVFLEDGKFQSALKELSHWIADQPFQSRSFYLTAYTLYVYLNRPIDAIEIAERGLKFHPADWSLHNIAAISNLALGNLEKARIRVASLRQNARTPYSKIFVTAAEGMLAFEEGQYSEAIKIYLGVVKASGKLGKPELTLSAAMWLLEGLCRKRLVDDGEFEKFLSLVKARLPKLSAAEVHDAERMVRAREFVCRTELAQQTLDFTNTSKPLSVSVFDAALSEAEQGRVGNLFLT